MRRSFGRQVVKFNGGDLVVEAVDDLARDIDRTDDRHVQIVTQLLDARGNLVKVDIFQLAISLSNLKNGDESLHFCLRTHLHFVTRPRLILLLRSRHFKIRIIAHKVHSRNFRIIEKNLLKKIGRRSRILEKI